MANLTQSTNTLAYLLPAGRTFANKFILGTGVRKTLQGLGKTLLRVDEIIERLPIEFFPDTTNELITEWEDLLGIPNAYFKGDGDLVERRTHVVAMLRANGVQTEQDFIDLAALLGVTVQITTGGVNVLELLPLDVPFVPARILSNSLFTWTCTTVGQPTPQFLIDFFDVLRSADTEIIHNWIP